MVQCLKHGAVPQTTPIKMYPEIFDNSTNTIFSFVPNKLILYLQIFMYKVIIINENACKIKTN
jgi:hypothetical protein